METWLSGRKRLTANEVGSKSPRRFESSRLREYKIAPLKRGAYPGYREAGQVGTITVE